MTDEEKRERLRNLFTKLYGSNNPEGKISPEIIDEVTKCIVSAEARKSTYVGALVGSAVGAIIPLMIEPLKKSFIIFTLVGGVYGSVFARYMHSKNCLSIINNLPHSEYSQLSNHKSFEVEKPLQRESLKRGSSIDIEAFQQIDQQNEFSSVNAHEYQPVINIDESEKKEKKVFEGITYDELRQKNRDSFRSGQVQHRYVKRSIDSRENKPTENQDFKSELNIDSDLFPMPSSTGDHKTKYGDIWD
ncbi:uncharacterized protein LOC124427963 [Vespa crabro]|uniref:uncharacterized protein LOC124427963 n=1 Tax=Vespa crabro TaxID=7445 RepID=UPI001F027612|nr:uncharacterized protein LOC124427963 [Vespa crabro]